MSFVNTTKKQTTLKDSHLNSMAGVSFDLTPLVRLQCMAASCFFGEPMYYHEDKKDTRARRNSSYKLTSPLSSTDIKELNEYLDSLDKYEWRNLSPKEMLEKAIDEALEFNAEETLKLAITLRANDHIRVTPQVIVVRAANNKTLKGTGLVQKYNSQIIQRLDEVSTQMAYQLAEYGKPIPNALKKSWKKVLENASDYQLAKYKMENRAVKTLDVVNLVHAKSEPIDSLMKGTLALGSNGLNTWESMRSAGKSWEEAIPVMGHMALLRNIRNFLENNIDTNLWIDKLINTAVEGKQLPFRYYSAYRNTEALASAQVKDAIEECLELSIGNLPKLKGKSLVLVDNSGSAQGTTTSSMGTINISTIGNLMGILTARVSDQGTVGVFGDRLELHEVRKKTSVFSELAKIEKMGETIGAGTEHGIWLALDKLIKNKEHVDNIFVYSDMQAGHGGLYGTDPELYKDYKWQGNHIHVPKLVSEYRKQVNPKVNVFLVQIAGQQDTIVPENYYRTFIIGGWGEGILQYADKMIKVADQLDNK